MRIFVEAIWEAKADMGTYICINYKPFLKNLKYMVTADVEGGLRRL